MSWRARRRDPSCRPYGGHRPAVYCGGGALRGPAHHHTMTLEDWRRRRWARDDHQAGHQQLLAATVMAAAAKLPRKAKRWVNPLVLIVLLLNGCRIGEASNPGPMWCPFDDSEPESVGQVIGCAKPWTSPPDVSECDKPHLEYEYGMKVHDDNGEDFFYSREFNGAREGDVFKLGPCGIGYYLDAVTHHGGVSGRCRHRVPLVLDELVPRPEDPEEDMHKAPTWHGDDDSGGGEQRDPLPPQQLRPRRCSGRQRASRRSSKLADTFVPPLTVEAADRSHRDAGLWAVDSVNPNAWQGAMSYLERTAADATAVQEVRKLKAAVDSAER